MFPLVCQRLKSHWLNYIEEARAKRLPAHERRREGERLLLCTALERDRVEKDVRLLITRHVSRLFEKKATFSSSLPPRHERAADNGR